MAKQPSHHPYALLKNMALTTRKINKYIEKATSGNFIQSTRRILATFCLESIETRGFYHADWTCNEGGSSILLKLDEKFFLLTCRHVTDPICSKPQNESPFFSHTFSKRPWEKITDLLFPLRGWDIGKIINQENSTVESEDIVLVELGTVMPGGFPDNFIDLDEKNKTVLTKSDFFEGMVLLAAGYPKHKNEIEFSEDTTTQTTSLNRQIYAGFFFKQDGFPMIRLTTQHTNAEISGVSGGIVTNLQAKRNQIAWAGMAQRAGGGIIRFVTADVLLEAIMSYKDSPHFAIDPIATISNLEAENSREGLEARKKHLRIIMNHRPSTD